MEKERARGVRKTCITVVVLGRVDAGKSTTVGHLIYQCGGVDSQKASDQCEDKFVWVLDKLKEERECGEITNNVGLRTFQTAENVVTITDVPGHRDFVKNLVTGTSTADAALLVISAAQGEFEAGFEDRGQTREHLRLVATFGVRQVVVIVNKMDSVMWSHERFDEIHRQVTEYLTEIGYHAFVAFVPLSGLLGDNMIDQSHNLTWWQGPTLLQTLDQLQPAWEPHDEPLRIPIRDLYRVGGAGLVPTGRVESGEARAGLRISFAPSGATATIKAHEMRHGHEPGRVGDLVGFSVKDSEGVQNVTRGDVCGDERDPPLACESFIALVVILDHTEEIRAGDSVVIHCHLAQVACRIHQLLDKLDRRTGVKVEDNPAHLKSGNAAHVMLVPLHPLCVEVFARYPALGRFVARNTNGQAVAVGVIKAVRKNDTPGSEEDS